MHLLFFTHTYNIENFSYEQSTRLEMLFFLYDFNDTKNTHRSCQKIYLIKFQCFSVVTKTCGKCTKIGWKLFPKFWFAD